MYVNVVCLLSCLFIGSHSGAEVVPPPYEASGVALTPDGHHFVVVSDRSMGNGKYFKVKKPKLNTFHVVTEMHTEGTAFDSTIGADLESIDSFEGGYIAVAERNRALVSTNKKVLFLKDFSSAVDTHPGKTWGSVNNGPEGLAIHALGDDRYSIAVMWEALNRTSDKLKRPYLLLGTIVASTTQLKIDTKNENQFIHLEVPSAIIKKLTPDDYVRVKDLVFSYSANGAIVGLIVLCSSKNEDSQKWLQKYDIGQDEFGKYTVTPAPNTIALNELFAKGDAQDVDKVELKWEGLDWANAARTQLVLVNDDSEDLSMPTYLYVFEAPW